MFQLGVLLLLSQVTANSLRLAEVKGRVRHSYILAHRNKRLIDRCISVGIDHKDVIVNRRSFSGKIEERVPREIDHGLLVGGRLVRNDDLVIIAQLIADIHAEITGISRLAIPGKAMQVNR